MSTILIATILIGLAVTVGESGISARLAALDGEYKRVSLALAESCANLALLNITQDYNYAGNESGISVGTDAQGRAEICTIGPITFPNGTGGIQNTVIIMASAQYPSENGANSTLTISATVRNPLFTTSPPASITINSWRETP